MMNSFPDQQFAVQKCGDDNEVKNWKNIQECANSTDGSNLLKDNGRRTDELNPTLSNVPTILFRNHFDFDAQKLATVSFRDALCKEINPKPIECSQSGASTTVLATMALVGAFIANQLF